MGVKLNAFEAFEIAEQIERNGAKFYRKVAEIFDDPQTRGMFLELAGWEIKHEEVFAAMRKELSRQDPEMSTFKPEEALPDVKAMAGLAVFGIRPDPSKELTGSQSREDVLKIAIEKEKDSIVFYSGLKDFVSARAGRDKVNDIIEEELRHIRILNQSLEESE